MKRAVALLGADEVSDIMRKEGKIEASASVVDQHALLHAHMHVWLSVSSA